MFEPGPGASPCHFPRFPAAICCKAPPPRALAATLPVRAAFAKDTVVGFVYVGSRDDYGYNQAHAAGAAALKKMAGIKVVEEEKVPETDAVEKTIELMINLDGATLLFPTSFGYFSPHVLKLANKFPKAALRACRRAVDARRIPKNAGSYFGYIDEAQYVSGIVAGHSTKTGKLGFVAAKPIPQLLRNINAFMLGARLANPNATMQVIFTGDWSMPVKEAEATNSLVDQGVDVLTCHVDGPKTVMENAARRGAMVSSYHVNRSPLAPQAYLTGAEWNWEVLYPRFVQDVSPPGETIPNFYRGGLKEDDRQSLALWAEGVRGRAQARRRRQGQAHRRRLRHLQGPAQGQQGQHRDRARHRSRPDRRRARKDELPGGRGHRGDLVTAAMRLREISCKNRAPKLGSLPALCG